VGDGCAEGEVACGVDVDVPAGATLVEPAGTGEDADGFAVRWCFAGGDAGVGNAVWGVGTGSRSVFTRTTLCRPLIANAPTMITMAHAAAIPRSSQVPAHLLMA
jgi:hypothetical protein